MPSRSEKQRRFMQMAAHESGRRWARRHGVKLPPKEVAEEFVRADKRKKLKK
ncbi:MAG: hypothetical protein ONB06_05790 [candidate division KSB1 bacterium]|nr:hypothetical protein [candidate division KSB1 bacterium]